MVKPRTPAGRPSPGAFRDPRRVRRIVSGILLVLIIGWRLWSTAHEGSPAANQADPPTRNSGHAPSVPEDDPDAPRPIPRTNEPSATHTAESPVGDRPESRVVRVKRVVDGDTLLLQDGVRLRMIGIDTPETKKEDTPIQPFGPEASEYTRNAVEGRQVTLVFDGEREDNYGRTLAHVYIGDRFLSEELIREGLARVLYRHPYSNAMKDRFRAAENAAKREKRGIWSLSQPGKNSGKSPLSRESSGPSREF